MFNSRAENALDSLSKGRRVVVGGALTVRADTRSDGQKVISNDIVADYLGADLTYTGVQFPAEDQAH